MKSLPTVGQQNQAATHQKAKLTSEVAKSGPHVALQHKLEPARPEASDRDRQEALLISQCGIIDATSPVKYRAEKYPETHDNPRSPESSNGGISGPQPAHVHPLPPPSTTWSCQRKSISISTYWCPRSLSQPSHCSRIVRDVHVSPWLPHVVRRCVT